MKPDKPNAQRLVIIPDPIWSRLDAIAADMERKGKKMRYQSGLSKAAAIRALIENYPLPDTDAERR